MTGSHHPFSRRRLFYAGVAGLGAGLGAAELAAQPAASPSREGRSVLSPIAFGAVGDGRGDDTDAWQRMLDAQIASGAVIHLPAGRFRITRPLVWRAPKGTDAHRAGLVIAGAGMGRTVLVNEVDDGRACLSLGADALDARFVKGISIANLSILGGGWQGRRRSHGLRLEACWLTTLVNVQCNGHNGAGLLQGDEPSRANPDDSASVSTTCIGCEFNQNAIGIDSPVGNNAPELVLINCIVTGNSRTGVWSNSSFLLCGYGTSIAFNGYGDPENAGGGLVVEERTRSSSGDPYTAKIVKCEATEFDSNYPRSIDLQSVERFKIEDCLVSWRDYATSPEIRALPRWPSELIRLGGDTRDRRTLGGTIENNRFLVVSDGALGRGPAGAADGRMSMVRIHPYAVGIAMRRNGYSFENRDGNGLQPGRTLFVLQEDDKSGTPYDAAPYYCDYDMPLIGVNPQSTSAMVLSPRRKVFEGGNTNLHHSFVLADQTAQSLPVPTLGASGEGRHWGMLAFSLSGSPDHSALVCYRAMAMPSCVNMSGQGGQLGMATGALDGRTGAAGRVTIAASEDGLIHVENRTGRPANIHLSFLMNPGVVQR